MVENLVIFLLVLGSFFILLSAIALLRLPDLYMRLSTTTKANTLGIGAMLTGMAIFFVNDVSTFTRSFAAILFILFTVPVSGHYLARVAYFIGIEKWNGMRKDDMSEKFGIKKEKK